MGNTDDAMAPLQNLYIKHRSGMPRNKKQGRFLSDLLPRIFTGMALVLQLIILGFLVLLSASYTVVLVRQIPPQPITYDEGNKTELYGPAFASEQQFIFHYWPSVTFVLGLIIALIAIALIVLGLRKFHSRTIFKALLTYTGILGAVWVVALNMHSYAYSDANSLIAIANAYNSTDHAAFSLTACDWPVRQPYCRVSPSLHNYLQYYPFQAGPAMWFALVFHWFGNGNVMAVQLINVMFVVITVACLWYLTEHLCQMQTARNAIAVLCATCVPLLMISAFVYTNVVGFAIVLVGVCVLVRCVRIENWWQATLGMAVGFIICGIGIMFKTTYIIVMIGVVIATVFSVWQTRRYWQLPLAAAMTVIAMKISNIPVAILERFAGYSFGKGMPTSSWIAIGLTDKWQMSNYYGVHPPRTATIGSYGAGWWTGLALKVFRDSDGNYAAQSAAIRDVLDERLQYFSSHPSYTVDFFMRKLASEWAEPTFGSRYYSELGTSSSHFTGNIASLLGYGEHSTLFRFENTWQTVIYVLAFIGVFAFLSLIIRQGFQTIDRSVLFSGVTLCASFIGGFICYVLWEAKSVYAFPFFLLLLPMAAYGTAVIARGLSQLWHRWGIKFSRSSRASHNELTR